MQLWLLRPKRGLPKGDNPWDPWYDKAFGFVVRAETEEAARKQAHHAAGQENKPTFINQTISQTDAPWLDDTYSDCTVLDHEGPEGIIIQDFASA